MVNKSSLKTGVKKLLLFYVILVPLPSTIYIMAFVFPQIPMMTLGYDYDGGLFSFGQDINNPAVRFSNQSVYLLYKDHYGVHIYKSEDHGYNWENLRNDLSFPSVSMIKMDAFNNTIGIAFDNSNLHERYFLYSENRGITWSAPRTLPFYLNSIGFINSTYLIACNDNWVLDSDDFNSTIYISKDLGLNWEIQSVISSYIPCAHRYTIGVTDNKTIFLFGLSSTDCHLYSIYRSTDLGKTWVEIETIFSEGRIIMGADNEFYVYSNLGNIYKSTDECQTWSHVEVTGVNRNDISSPVIDINEDGEIFVVYTKNIPRFAFNIYDYYALDYFWVGHDIWTGRYVSYFLAFFLPAAGIGFLVILAIYSLYTVIKGDNPRNKTKTQVYLK